MSKKLVCLAFVMLLGLYTGAKADIMLDDFEGYMSNTELNGEWVTVFANSGLTTRTLVESPCGEEGNYQAMQWDYAVDGTTAGGNNSDNLYDLSNATIAAPINMTTLPGITAANWNIDFCLKSLGGNLGSPGDILYVKFYQGAGVVTEAWATPDGSAPFGVQSFGKISDFMTGDCTEVKVTSDMLIDWAAGWPPLYVFSNLTAVTGILIGDCGNGVISGSFIIDNLRITPEPATIALLGLGALAMLRRKYSH